MIPIIKALVDPKQRRALYEMKARLEKRDRQEAKRKEKQNVKRG
jgi:hypothetical protein